MWKRRDFLAGCGATAAMTLSRRGLLAQTGSDGQPALRFASGFMDLELSPTAPKFLSLDVDGLGQGVRGANPLDPNKAQAGYKTTGSLGGNGGRVEYRVNDASDSSPACWTFDISASKIVLTSEWSGLHQPPPLQFHFDLGKVHTTVLGLFSPVGLLRAPALMHLPGQGSMRLTSSVSELCMTYTSDRRVFQALLSLPAATIQHQRAVYTLEVAAIYPDLPGIQGDARFDPFRRNWLDVLQLNPYLQALANNTASDSCAFCYYEFADIASLTPPLVEGLTALDVVRQTLDRMLAGGWAYGASIVPDRPSYTSDFLPAMAIAASDCAPGTRGQAWLRANYDGIRAWVDSMLATDTDGDGLIKYGVSGNSGTWTETGTPKIRPSNWWDTIGFAHEDAYSNALAYRAYRNMATMAKTLGKTADSAKYRAAALTLRDIFYQKFYDPATGVLGGWRSADGELHDYYFLFVNGIAIHYGLVKKPEANRIMDKLVAKMKEVGYDKFNMGLPGNLVTVPLKDYVHKTPDGHIGGGVRPDNADGFQNYENGGATGSFAFFFIAALYDLGRKAEADEILLPMLGEYGRCGFEGRDAKGRSNDWRRWDGTAMGYEGFLTDNYYAILAVAMRQSETPWQDGYRPATELS